MNTNKYAIAIDLGGTSIKFALVDGEGNFLFSDKIPARADESADAVVEQLVKAVKLTKAYADQHNLPVKGVGIGTPGIIDTTNRIILGGADNIKGWENLPLADIMERQTELPVFLNNDANLMGLGETHYGAGKGCTHVVFLTIGTGIGGAIIINGELFNGFDNRGTELGHTPLFTDGEPCNCGSVGCLETYASTSALVRSFVKANKEAGREIPEEKANGITIVKLYKEGDTIATKCLDDHCYYLGRGIAGFINIFSPQRIVIGGGLSEAGDFYIEKIREHAMKNAMKDTSVNTVVMGATLGNKAGCMGAAYLVFSLTD